MTENRRRQKRVEWCTDDYLRGDVESYRYKSGGRLPFDVPLLRMETDELSAETTAEQIRQHLAPDNG